MAVYCDNTMKSINKMFGQNVQLLYGLAELRKATISFVTSICLSVRPHGTTRPHIEKISMKFHNFRKRVEKIQFSRNSRTKITVLHMKTCVHPSSYLAEVFSE